MLVSRRLEYVVAVPVDDLKLNSVMTGFSRHHRSVYLRERNHRADLVLRSCWSRQGIACCSLLKSYLHGRNGVKISKEVEGNDYGGMGLEGQWHPLRSNGSMSGSFRRSKETMKVSRTN
jgi:hypothetical protein